MQIHALATRVLLGAATLGALTPAPSADAANLLNNAGFESQDTSGGDVFGPADWDFFNEVFVSSMSAAPFEGSNVMKAFGPFFDSGGAGATQTIAGVSPGETFKASVQAQNWNGDAIGEGNFAVVKIDFLDAGDQVIGVVESAHIDNTLPLDTWTEFSTMGTAPEGAVAARYVLVHVQLEPISGGSVFFDNALFEQVTAGLLGDTDGDGDIDDFDLLNAISNFTGSLEAGVGGKGVPEGDTDADADVDDFDLLNMISGFTGSLSAPAVPEPGSIALLGLGGLAILRRRRSA